MQYGAVVVVAGLLSAGIPSPTEASQPDAPSASAATSAVENLRGEIEGETVPTSESPADIPRDPEQPVTFEGSAVTVAIETDGSTATKEVDGMIVYQGTEESASTVVQPTDEGVRFMTVIKDAKAPSEYAYDVTVPVGGALIKNADGSVSVKNAADEEVMVVPKPWAKDANGVLVPTEYVVEGTELRQKSI